MGTDSKRKPTDLFTALAHPMRRRVLRTMLREGAEMTPLELSIRLAEPLSALSYHVRVLEECETLTLTRTQRVRGATQHFYRPTVRTKWVLTALQESEDSSREKPGQGEEKA